MYTEQSDWNGNILCSVTQKSNSIVKGKVNSGSYNSARIWNVCPLACQFNFWVANLLLTIVVACDGVGQLEPANTNNLKRVQIAIYHSESDMI